MSGPGQFLEQFEGGPARHGGWTLPLRREAIERLKALGGFPTSKNEDWKYTPVGPILEPKYRLPLSEQAPHPPSTWLEPAAIQLVFWNGQFAREQSSAAGLPPGVVVGPLSDALLFRRELLEAHLGSVAKVDSAFAALNTAFMEDGGFVFLPAGVILGETVQLVFVADPARGPLAIHPRTVILLGAGAQASVVETHRGWSGEGPYLNNPVTEVLLGEGARLHHFKQQLESPAGFHVGRVVVENGAGAELSSHTLQLGARVARTEVICRLSSPHASCTLNGLYAGRGRQHLDTDTRIEHSSPGCRSRELFHGILDQQARGIFTGRVLVTAAAQQTDAGQTNRNLLLSEDAEAKTRPHLQILADDVKCGHGATVGALDEEALFYLRSRGIDDPSARALLTWAFATAVTSALPLRPWREEAERRLAAWLEVGKEALG